MRKMPFSRYYTIKIRTNVKKGRFQIVKSPPLHAYRSNTNL